MNRFKPKLHILPPAQRRLWDALSQVPPSFVLYGGTAAALRFGHRQSLDFDFFSSESFQPRTLWDRLPFCAGGTPLQSEPNTLTLMLTQGGPVKVSFFGGLTMGRVSEPERTADTGLPVASMLDLAGTKARVVIERAESKDYLDLAVLLRSGVTLAEALGAARALFGAEFNPLITLKALSYYADGDLPHLPEAIKQFLTDQASGLSTIPSIPRRSNRIGEEFSDSNS